MLATRRFPALPLLHTAVFHKALFALAALVLFAAPQAFAQQGALRADEAFQLSASRAADGTLTLAWRIAPGTYLYRDSLKATHDGAPVALSTPPGEEKDDPNFGMVSVFHHEADATAAGLPAFGSLSVSFQGCAEDGICYPPVTKKLDLSSLRVGQAPGLLSSVAGKAAPAASPFTPVDLATPKQDAPSASAERAVPAAAISAATEPATAQASAPRSPQGTAPSAGLGAGLLSGGLLPMLAAFLGFGLLLAFTPCVFPMIPILSGILAGSGAPPTPGRSFRLSLSYVAAMAAAYGLLGLVAGWSGANLQAALQTPWALGLMAAVFVGLALSMFGLFELALPSALASRLSGGNAGGSLTGAAVLGFASALVVGPCVTPPLAAALLYAAQTGDGARGGAALFMLGLGMGVPLLVAGTFGAHVLPRSGRWLEVVKRACGVLFLGVAIYLSARLLPAPLTLALWGLLALGLAVFLGAFDRLGADSAAPARLRKAAGLASLIYGITLIVGAAGGAGDPARPLAFLSDPVSATGATAEAPEARITSTTGLDAALATAGKEGRPVLVTFSAGWCTVCKSNEKVMAGPEARDLMAGLPRIEADVTDYGPDERALMARFDVIGPPTLFLLDAEGRELPGSRHIGAITQADLSSLAAKAGL